MNTKILGLRISAALFLIIAILHLLRFFLNIDVVIGTWTLPVPLSLGAFFILFFFSVWLFLIASKEVK